LNREVRFTWWQQRARQWIAFRELAEWLLEFNGGDAYDMLQRDLLAGDFEEGGRSKVLYLHYLSPRARMTRQRLNDVLDTFSLADVRSEYLARCWLPRRMFDRWLAKHELLSSPARFEPQEEAREQPTSVSRRGRRPRADWDAVELAFLEVIKTRGLPDDDNIDPNWRRQADAESWVGQLLEDRGEPIGESWLREKVREILARIKAGN
jgi:hypothetical protein